MSGEGGEVVVFNTGERALSTDLQRLQSFRTRDAAEAWRFFVDYGFSSDDFDAGSSAYPQTPPQQLTAEVIGGLLVRPQIASLNLIVDPGLLFAITQDANPDNSVYEYVNDPGVQSVGLLTMTTNPPGSSGTRIDVVECSLQEVILETDSRDVFSPSTGLFTAQQVTKATAAQLVYRVRAGAAAGGFPGVVAGWLPLMVASVPVGALTCDAMTFWDVRPLLNDRAPSVQASPNLRPRRLLSLVNGSTPAQFSGFFDVAYNGRRLGGKTSRGTPGTDYNGYVDLTDAANQDPAASGLTSGQMWFLWLATPFGLPRWARYTDASATIRVPRSPRGIPFLSPVVPNADGTPQRGNVPTLPVSLGFNTVAATSAVAVCAGTWGSGTPNGLIGGGSVDAEYPSSPPGAGTTTISGNTATGTLTAGQNFSAMAHEILVVVSLTVNFGGSVPKLDVMAATISNPGAPSSTAFEEIQEFTAAASTEGRIFRFWMPLSTLEPTDLQTSSYTVVVSLGGGDTIVAAAISVAAWRN